jgi:hypothetical protein
LDASRAVPVCEMFAPSSSGAPLTKSTVHAPLKVRSTRLSHAYSSNVLSVTPTLAVSESRIVAVSLPRLVLTVLAYPLFQVRKP